MDFGEERARMVQEQIKARGISDASVSEAMGKVPRERFVPASQQGWAYADAPLSIGHGQTISQPYIVALTAEALRISPDARVLEIGAGSGYAAAVLGQLAREVYAVEWISELAQEAGERLRALGMDHVHVICADGSAGLPEHAPYDGIAVAAAAPYVPDALVDQLAPGGRLVIPVGSPQGAQQLYRFTRQHDGSVRKERLLDVRFVPLVAPRGWDMHA